MCGQTAGQPSNPGVFLTMPTPVSLITGVITKHSYCTKHCVSFALPLSSFSTCLESNYMPNRKGEQVETSLPHPLLGLCFPPGLRSHLEELPSTVHRAASLFSSTFSFTEMWLTAVRWLGYDKATAYLGWRDLLRAHMSSRCFFSLERVWSGDSLSMKYVAYHR